MFAPDVGIPGASVDGGVNPRKSGEQFITPAKVAD
jgi:hypothetical protein